MQEACHEVEAFYHEIGLKVNTPDVMPDHIGVELNFLAVLCEMIDMDPERRLHHVNIAKRFLQEHVANWVPQFTLDMEEAATSQFYKALALATRDSVRECVSIMSSSSL
jgi:anaerobic sulfite reductase subunit A